MTFANYFNYFAHDSLSLSLWYKTLVMKACVNFKVLSDFILVVDLERATFQDRRLSKTITQIKLSI